MKQECEISDLNVENPIEYSDFLNNVYDILRPHLQEFSGNKIFSIDWKEAFLYHQGNAGLAVIDFLTDH